MEYYIILAFLLSFLANSFIIKVAAKYPFIMDPLSNEKIQSFHKNPTPRIGGLSIYVLTLLITLLVSKTMFLIILAFLPSFIYGIYEDIKGNTPHKIRLLLMAVSTFIAILSTGITVKSMGFLFIPEYIQIPFTIFAVIGIASAINFIDGLNGLASGVTMLTFGFIGLSAYGMDNPELFASMLIIFSIILGFFVLNFPFGKIFLGDAGAYYLGYVLAMSSQALAFDNNLIISPWFPVALLGYPIIETLFTMRRRYRRLKNKGIGFFQSERVHLHSLLYLRVMKNNPAASVVILILFSALTSILAFQFRYSNIACFTIFLLEVFLYLFTYQNLVNFKIGKLVINISGLLWKVRYNNFARKLSNQNKHQNKHAITKTLYKQEGKLLVGKTDGLE